MLVRISLEKKCIACVSFGHFSKTWYCLAHRSSFFSWKLLSFQNDFVLFYYDVFVDLFFPSKNNDMIYIWPHPYLISSHTFVIVKIDRKLMSYLIYFIFNKWNIQHDYLLFISFVKNEIYQIGQWRPHLFYLCRFFRNEFLNVAWFGIRSMLWIYPLLIVNEQINDLEIHWLITYLLLVKLWVFSIILWNTCTRM